MVLLTVTVGAITASMARAFSQDKIAYVNDVAAIVATSTSAESAAILRGYVQAMDEVGAILTERGAAQDQLSADLLARRPELLSVSLITVGRVPATLYDKERLAALGLNPGELVKQALARVADKAPVDSASLRVGTLDLANADPLLILAQPLPSVANEPLRLVLMCIRSDQIARAVERGRGFRSALVDSTGEVLVASRGGSEAARGWIRAMFQLDVPTQAGVVTREFEADGTGYLAARAPVRVAGVIAITAIPRAAAYLTARELLAALLLVSVALMIAGALVALLVARRLTTPLEKLAVAAEGIGQGRFDIRIQSHTSDEIGALAGAFNAMAAGLQERDAALASTQQALVQSEKMSAFGQLSAGIAHEVKNPLAGILGHTQLVMRTLGPEHPAIKNLALVAGETRRCSDIITNLMRFARQDKPKCLPVDVNAVVDAASAIVAHQLSLQRITVVRATAERLPAVAGDFNQLQQVIVNLLINAQQAMDAKRGEIAIRTRADADRVVIEVADNGPGMTPEVQARVFEPFFTTKPQGRGTGLGLSVTYGIIESHRGRISVQSRPGEGATFVVSLPLAVTGEAEAAA
ncbi:MAG: ATP-binding protein, partial [Steroidobacteraceae bacterium]